LAIRSSIDALRPSLDTFSELSKSGRLGSKCAPRHARSVMKSRTSCDACLLITCRAPVSNSGMRPLCETCSRVTGRSLLPVAFSSTLVVVPVNTAPYASTPRSSQVRTRERARAELAEKLAEQREREKANETDLVEFFRNDELLTEADAARAAAVTAAQRDYDTTLASVQQRQAECLRTLADRGEKVDDLTP